MLRAPLLVASFVLLGCSAEEPVSETTGEPAEPGTLIHAAAVFDDHCGSSDEVVLVATRIDCATGGPCTLQMNPFKTFESDPVTCTTGGRLLTAVVTQSGLYSVEVRALTGETIDGATCWATTNTATSVLVTSDQIDDAAEINVDQISNQACPEP